MSMRVDKARDRSAHPMSLLIVDDDVPFRTRLVRAFRERGYEVRQFNEGKAAIADASASGSTELALVDLRMPGEWGLNVVKALVDIDKTTLIVVLTAYGSIATALEAIRLGATSYLQKPATIEEIEYEFFRDRSGISDTQSREDPPIRVPSLARAEWEHINRVLTECGGNIRQAAKLLGLHRRTLQRKLAKFPSPK